MTAQDITYAVRWMEGHLSALDDEAAGHEHAHAVAQTETDRAMWADELAAVRDRQAQWREVIRRSTTAPRRGDHQP